MKIERVETKIITIPVREPYVFSHGVLKAFSNVLVQIWCDEGLFGVGEASFVPGGVSVETPEGVKYAIEEMTELKLLAINLEV